MIEKLKSGAKGTIRRTLNRLGYDVVMVQRGNASYQCVMPLATYSPWNADAAFIETWDAIRSHTLVDEYRCYELWTLVEQSRKLRGSLLEVGVWRGGTGALIARRAALCGIEDPVYLADTFTGVVKTSDRDSTYRGGEHSDTSREFVERLLERLGLPNAEILAGVFPESAADLVASPEFRFCHIDVDSYGSGRDTLEWVWPRLVVGGIVVFDDYGFSGCDGITRYVEEVAPRPDRILIHNLNGHAILIRIA